MLRSRPRVASSIGLAAAALAFAVQPVAAIHQDAVLDCGTAGTYSILTHNTGAGLFPPSFVQVDLLTEDGKRSGTLVPFAISINGVWLDFVGVGAYDAVAGGVDLGTCTFTAANGDDIVLVGILNIP